jgi:hypothetical protein
MGVLFLYFSHRNQGHFTVQGIITHSFPLSEIQKAFSIATEPLGEGDIHFDPSFPRGLIYIYIYTHMIVGYYRFIYII